MALIKHVDGRNVEMTPDEEAAFEASRPQSQSRPERRQPTKAELMARLDEIEALVRALPGD